MLIGLIIILLMVFFLPFFVKPIEENLEAFLFVMGISASLISGMMTKELAIEALEEPIMIASAVIIAGTLFHLLKNQFANLMNKIYTKISVPVVVFFTVAILGFLSSIITAIVASIILVEIISLLPVTRKQKIIVCIISCFSIGLGAVLTPLGEPLSTIAVSKMNGDFFYLFDLLAKYIIPSIIFMAVLGAVYVTYSSKKEIVPALEGVHIDNEIAATSHDDNNVSHFNDITIYDLIWQEPEKAANAALLEQISETRVITLVDILEKDAQIEATERILDLLEEEAQKSYENTPIPSLIPADNSIEEEAELEDEGWKGIFLRGAKVYLFVMALVFLGEGFAPLIDKYVLNLDYHYLYWINTVSAVLDNATLTAAELSPQMTPIQVEMILMGLLISGGMLIPGNIPNIISASKLKITSKEWAVVGLPMGAVLMVIMYVILLYFN